MLIDTHCHLDAAEFDVDRDAIAAQAFESGVQAIVVPAVARSNFDSVIDLTKKYSRCAYALGVHPMYVESAVVEDLHVLERYVQNGQPVAIGEIGLDYFVANPKDHPTLIRRQNDYFEAQLSIAKQYRLPVILHVRHAIDEILKHLRQIKLSGGIAHAFNGSFQQAQQFIDLGFKLGFGGTMTYDRALKIRALAKQLPLDAIVLETDAPDIPPSWMGKGLKNSPCELPKIAQVFADLRQLNITQVIDITGANACAALPKLAYLCTPVKVAL